MPVNRKRAKRDMKGTVSAWVEVYLSTGKEPQKGEKGYDEWCWYNLLRLNVNGLPEQPGITGWFYNGNE
jgi:hypothetical protein